MKSTLFVISIVLLLGSAIFFIGINVYKNNIQNYWGDNLTNGIWLSKDNNNVAAFKIKEGVKGYFSGSEIPENEKYLLTIRLVEPDDKTDYEVNLPRLFNKDNVLLPSSEIVEKFLEPGSAVIDIVKGENSEYINSIFFPPSE